MIITIPIERQEFDCSVDSPRQNRKVYFRFYVLMTGSSLAWVVLIKPSLQMRNDLIKNGVTSKSLLHITLDTIILIMQVK